MGKKEKDWIASIKEGDEKELNGLYSIYKEEFLVWSGTMYKLSEEQAADVFQDAVITFYWNIRKEKLTMLTSSVKTYLFAIGKNLALKKLKKEERIVVDNEMMEYNANFEYDELSLELTDRQQVIGTFLEKLGDPCRSILKMFYFDCFSMESIALRLDYKNENVVKSQKLRCLQKLKELFESHTMSKGDV